MSTSTPTPTHSDTAPFFDPPGWPTSAAETRAQVTLFGWLARHLRGRLLFASLLIPLVAALGGVLGYRFIVPTHRSSAVLQYAPEATAILYGSREDRTIPMFDAFLEAQLVAIRHPGIITAAMKSPTWTAFHSKTKLSAIEFRDALNITRTKRTQTIELTFEHKSPTAAQSGVQAVVAAYVKHFQSTHQNQAANKSNVLKTYLKQLTTRQADLAEQEIQLTNAYEATGLTQLHVAKLAQISDLQTQMRDVDQQRAVSQRQIDAHAAALNLSSNEEDAAPDRDRHLATQDAAYANLLTLLQERQREAERLRARTGSHHLQVIRLNREVVSLRDQLDARGVEIQAHPQRAKTNTSETLNHLIAQLDGLEGLHQTLQKQLNDLETEAAELGHRRVEIRHLEAELLATNALIKDTQFNLETQRLESHRTSPLTVLTDGDTPNSIHMGRKQAQAGVIGAGLGGLLSLGLLLAWGRLDERINGFQDIRDHFPSQPVLALVPTLVGDLSDPDESLVAAMAVHEIRSKLQRSFPPDDPSLNPDHVAPGKVLTLTGPTPGVGKTTLSMALAMSFARTGTRTLIIDLDLIGRGVTQHCGLQHVTEGEGVLAVLGGEALENCCHPSLVRHLWVLPATQGGERRVADLSLKHVRKLIQQARKQFEQVIVDTGPLLGSLECSLVLPESDDVLLVISRGDEGAVVRQAVKRLINERIHLSGLIFNRAANKDCERFSSSLTSRTSGPSRPIHLTPPAGPLAATQQYGPIAYATASCLARDN